MIAAMDQNTQNQPPSTPATGNPAPKPPRRWVGTTVAVLLVAALVGGAWYLVQGKKAAPGGQGGPGMGGPAAMRAMAVTVGHAAVQRQTLPVTLTAMGTVVPTTTVTLTSQVSGILRDVLFTEGQMVKKGQQLAQIDPRPFEQALQQAKGQLARDQAQLDAARVTLKRYQTLWTQDSIARQDLDTQAATAKQLEGTVIADQAQVQTAQLNLGYTKIASPIDGRIGLRSIDAGNYVSAGGTTGIAVITKVAPIDVSFTVPQDQIPAVLAAQRGDAPLAVAALDRTGNQQLATGQFLTLDNLVDTATGTVKAKARFTNEGGELFPNQFVNTRLTLKDISSLVVPVTAIRTGGNGDFVYVVNPNRTVSQRTVIRGMSTVEWVAITTGLKEGELVVTEGADRLKDGAAVALQGDTPNQAQGASSGRRGGQGKRGDGAGGRAGSGAGAAPANPAAVEPNAGQPSPAAPVVPGSPPNGEANPPTSGDAKATGAPAAATPVSAPAAASAPQRAAQ